MAVECPGCRTHLAVAGALAGGAAACPTCQTAFVVPVAAPPAPRDGPVELAEPPLPSTRRRPDDAFLLVEPAALPSATDPEPFAVRERPMPTAGGDTAVTIRLSTPDGNRVRRPSRNLLYLLAGAAVLVALAVILVTRGR